MIWLSLALATPLDPGPETSRKWTVQCFEQDRRKACVDLQAAARRAWAAGQLTESPEDSAFRRFQADGLAERACDLGDAPSCVAAGRLEDACRHGICAPYLLDTSSMTERLARSQLACDGGDRAACDDLEQAGWDVPVRSVPGMQGELAYVGTLLVSQTGVQITQHDGERRRTWFSSKLEAIATTDDDLLLVGRAPRVSRMQYEADWHGHHPLRQVSTSTGLRRLSGDDHTFCGLLAFAPDGSGVGEVREDPEDCWGASEGVLYDRYGGVTEPDRIARFDAEGRVEPIASRKPLALAAGHTLVAAIVEGGLLVARSGEPMREVARGEIDALAVGGDHVAWIQDGRATLWPEQVDLGRAHSGLAIHPDGWVAVGTRSGIRRVDFEGRVLGSWALGPPEPAWSVAIAADGSQLAVTHRGDEDRGRPGPAWVFKLGTSDPATLLPNRPDLDALLEAPPATPPPALPGDHVVTGVVTLDGAPAADVSIELIPKPLRGAWSEAEPPLTSRRTTTAADGSFRFEGLSRAEYTVEASTSTHGAQRSASLNGRSPMQIALRPSSSGRSRPRPRPAPASEPDPGPTVRFDDLDEEVDLVAAGRVEARFHPGSPPPRVRPGSYRAVRPQSRLHATLEVTEGVELGPWEPLPTHPVRLVDGEDVPLAGYPVHYRFGREDERLFADSQGIVAVPDPGAPVRIELPSRSFDGSLPSDLPVAVDLGSLLAPPLEQRSAAWWRRHAADVEGSWEAGTDTIVITETAIDASAAPRVAIPGGVLVLSERPVLLVPADPDTLIELTEGRSRVLRRR